MSDNFNSLPPQFDRTADHPRHRRMIEPLISLYQDGEASHSEKLTVEQYLKTCRECQAVNHSYEDIGAGLRSYLGTIPAPRLGPEAYAFLKETPTPTSPLPARSGSTVRMVPPTAPAFGRSASGPVSRRKGGVQLAFSLGLAGMTAVVVVIVGLLIFGIVSRDGVGQPIASPVVANQPVTTLAPDPTSSPDANPTAPPVTSTAPIQPPLPTPDGRGNATTEPTQRPQTVAPPSQPTPTPGGKGGQVSTPEPPTAAPVIPATAGIAQKTPPTATPVPAKTAPPVATPQPTTPPATTAPPVATTAPPASPEVTTAASTVAPSTDTPVVGGPVQPASTPVPAPTTVAPSPTSPTFTSPVSNLGWIAYVDKTDLQIHLVHSDGLDDLVISTPDVLGDLVWEQLVWSSDARWLAAVGYDPVKGERAIYMLDSKVPRQIEQLAAGFAPVWSPDSRSIAYLAAPVSINNGIKQGRPAILNLKKRLVTIVGLQNESVAPQWFEGGDRLLLGQDRVYDLESGQTTGFKLPFTNECLVASLSPVGNKLAVLEEQPGGKFDTVIYGLTKGRIEFKTVLQRVTAPIQGRIGLKCGAQRVHWTADSRTVYYYTSGEGSFSTCLIGSVSGTARCLNNVYEPSFNYDASYLVDYSPNAGLVYTSPATITARSASPNRIAEARFAPVWQPK